jgi:hypothetical protein
VTCTGIPDGTYDWQAWAEDAGGAGTAVGFGAGTNDQDFKIDNTGPTAPTTFSVTDATSGSTCNATWANDATDGTGIGLDATTFKVYWQTGSAPACGAGTLGCTEASGSTACSIGSLTDDVEHFFTQCVYDALDNETTGLNTTCTPTTVACDDTIDATCLECHGSGANISPVDSATQTRDWSTGEVTGDHRKTAHVADGTAEAQCRLCHAAVTGGDQNHRDGLIAMNAAGIAGGYYDQNDNQTDDDDTFAQSSSPTTGACSSTSCHGTSSPIWGVGTLTCDDCHNSNGADHTGTNEDATTHNTTHDYSGSTYITNCTTCHGHEGSGGTHGDGTVNFNATNLVTTDYNEDAGNFNGSCTTSCHDSDSGDWELGLRTDICVDCHLSSGSMGTAGAATSGLHTGTLTVSGNTHDDSFDDGNSGTATCETCHTTTPSTGHYDGSKDGTQANFAANVGYADGTPETCGPSSGMSTCHDDGGAWSREWSTTATASNGDECANCHGDVAKGWVTGVSLRHETDTELEANHDGTDMCVTCHAWDDGGTYPEYIWGTHHRNGTIEINNQLTFVDGGALVGCSDCHVATGGTGDGGYQFQDTFSGSGGLSRWGRDQTNITGPSVSCVDCHNSNGADHTDTNEAVGTHDTTHDYSTSTYIASCTTCHGHEGSGGNHKDGTVQFNATNLVSTNYNVDTGNFDGSCTTSCHDSDAGDWELGLRTDACVDCHSSAGTMGSDPTSGLHSLTPTISGASGTHDETLTGGCEACHTTAPSSSHVDGTLQTSYPTIEVNPPTGSFTDGTPPVCTSTCHSDNAAWSREWSDTADNTDGTECANCHGNWVQGWVTGVSLRHTGTDADGQIRDEHDEGDDAEECFTCHTYDEGVTTYYDFSTDHNDGNIDINDNVSFADNGTTVGCAICHSASDGTSDEQHEFSDTTARWTRFMRTGPAPTCLTCHTGVASDTGVTDRGNDGVRAIIPEFSKQSHHVDGDTTLATTHCSQCHCEGTSSGGVDGTKHKNGHIELRNTDSTTCNTAGTDHYVFWNTSGTYSWAGLDNHCFSCHDTAGAAGTGGWSGSADDKVPFNDSPMTNTYDQIERTRVVDVDTQFNTGNYSHHAVKGAKYNTTPAGASLYDTGGSPSTLFTSYVPLKEASSVRDTSVLSCADCHTAGDAAIGAHGSANEYMLYTTSADATQGADADHAVSTYVCWLCHPAGVYDQGRTGHPSSGTSCMIDTSDEVGLTARKATYGNITGMACTNCHNVGVTGWGGIHGGNNTYSPYSGGSSNTYRFMPGMGNSRYDAYTGCATVPDTGWGACDKHPLGMETTKNNPVVGRSLSY